MASAFFTKNLGFCYWQTNLLKVTPSIGKSVLIKFVAILMILRKLSTLDLFKRTGSPEKKAMT